MSAEVRCGYTVFVVRFLNVSPSEDGTLCSWDMQSGRESFLPVIAGRPADATKGTTANREIGCANPILGVFDPLQLHWGVSFGSS